MSVLGIGPGGQIGDDVELAQEIADDFVGVVVMAQLLELRNGTCERGFDFRNSTFGVVLSLAVEQPLMLEKLFSIKVGNDLGAADRQGCDSGHSIPKGHVGEQQQSKWRGYLLSTLSRHTARTPRGHHAPDTPEG